MLACAVNVSEGRRPEVLDLIATAAGDHVLDVHTDFHHHRTVITLGGPEVEGAALGLARAAVALLDIGAHSGAHPRLGVVDVVPFAAVPGTGSTEADAVAARDRFVGRASSELALPCFVYGPERSLPEVRRQAFASLPPDAGPDRPHPTAGAVCAGARPVLVAYNVWLGPAATPEQARAAVRAIRGPEVRALALDLGGRLQVSCNLVAPHRVGPEAVFDAVAALVPVARAELVGLAPEAVVAAVSPRRRAELDLDPSRTIEARLEGAGW